ncbi:MAG: RluA family pseudouridine synthase [Holosporales bacterium]|jgi:23S rRNA pseudouridine1911/1915/1917 synthase|nr:RluA family pseudouridine synthase [Holosporales bacterium]
MLHHYNDEIKLEVSKEYIGKRLDVVLADILNDTSRSQVTRLIKAELVTVDGIVILDPSQKIRQECTICVDVTETVKDDYEIIPNNIPVDILYEDEYFVVINKATGMVCHPAPGHKTNTLVNALAYHFDELSNVGNPIRPGIVHRLDKDTSGAMIIAKTNKAHYKLAEMFASDKGNSLKRKYVCFVYGCPTPKNGRIETFITRHPKLRQQFTTSDTNGKNAITLYKVKATKYFTPTNAISMVECELLTGRTHQIRVHMKHIGYHIVGDPVYGKRNGFLEDIHRQALHSSELYIKHPFTSVELTIKAPMPADLVSCFKELVEQLS